MTAGSLSVRVVCRWCERQFYTADHIPPASIPNFDASARAVAGSCERHRDCTRPEGHRPRIEWSWTKGADELAPLRAALERGRRLHPGGTVFADLRDEVDELSKALREESPDRQRAEALDVAVCAFRIFRDGDGRA